MGGREQAVRGAGAPRIKHNPASGVRRRVARQLIASSDPSPSPPQQITDRVQVTRQLVFAATQTFDDAFTVNDVVERMTGSANVDAGERQRVRSSIAQAMATLHERGEVVKESQGIGRQQTVWRKAILKINSNGAGVHA